MKINSIKITNLFEIFNYDISLKTDENVLIITGPNGFGKTMILNIIFNLFNRKFKFFQTLVFDSIIFHLDENIKIILSKTIKDGKPNINFSFIENEVEMEKFEYSHEIEDELQTNIRRQDLPFRKLDPDEWVDDDTDRILTTDDLLNRYADQLPDKIAVNVSLIKSKRVNDILASIQIHLIREQRLFKRVQHFDRRRYRDEKEQPVLIEVIQTYSGELKQLISEFSQKSFIQTQELNNSYLKRLTSENDILTREEYEKRYSILEKKQKKLTEFELYENKQELLNYNDADAKALSLYLKDFELKLGLFDPLLEKLELFTSILNERRFAFKSMNISRAKGFYVKTSKEKELELNQLSLGEQHEVILLYELIFNAKSNTLVLIDEPAVSVHITWQKEFLNDLTKIIKIQNIQALIATHSPSIINNRWDLVHNLETA